MAGGEEVVARGAAEQLGIEVLYRYVAAPGGEFRMTADFGEEQFKVS